MGVIGRAVSVETLVGKCHVNCFLRQKSSLPHKADRNPTYEAKPPGKYEVIIRHNGEENVDFVVERSKVNLCRIQCHFMTDEFHLMPDEIHFMTEPTER